MKLENHELNLLSNVSKTLTENSDPAEIVTVLARIFNRFGRSSNKFVELQKLNIYIYDENIKVLKDYSKSWVVVERPNENTYNDKLYLVITQLAQFNFFVNGIPYKMEDLVNLQNIKINNEKNTLLFPLKKNERPFGILELTFPHNIENLLDTDFFMMLSIVSYLISLKIQNSILAEQMQKNIDFHRSMKDIAKIIETQYELNYIIPMIGEMIDRFVSNHLIYVFLRQEGETELKLVWPNACRDQSVAKIVSQVTSESKIVFMNERKIGIFPLLGKKVLGCIVAHSTTTQLSDKEIEYLEQLSKQSSITLQRANSYAEVLQHATLDALTGLNNRRQFESRLGQEVATAKRQGKPLCAIMMDVDFFKKVNDSYGHTAGDCVLKEIARVIKSSLRESDIPSRYGGEEFAILLPFTQIDEAYTVAERLRVAVESTPMKIPNEGGEGMITLKKTISLGLYQYQETDTAEELYQKADKALYEAKETGRNKVVIYKEEAPAQASK